MAYSQYISPATTFQQPVTQYLSSGTTLQQPMTVASAAPTYVTAPSMTSFATPTVTSFAAPASTMTRVVGQPVVSSMAYSALQTAFVQSSDSPWGGGCPWQSDKTAFKAFCKAAIENPSGKERKELYGFLAECFLDADADRDGLVKEDEFDALVERAASLPRRFGMAPSWTEIYGDVQHRRQGRHQMFVQMDAHKRGAIGLEDWVAFSIAHISEKVRTMKPNTLDFAHLAGVGGDQFVAFCELAVNNAHSEEYKSLYEHLFKVFVESDVEEAGKVHWQNFDMLIEDAAKAPRDAGLAPSTAEAYRTEAERVAARRAEFSSIDKNGTGEITFDMFLQWAVKHIDEKVRDYRAGKRYVKPNVSTYAGPVTVSGMACPITGSVGMCPVSTVVYRR